MCSLQKIPRKVLQNLLKEVISKQTDAQTRTLGKNFHTVSGKVLFQQWKVNEELSLPQVKVPEIAKDDLLTFRGMKTDFPCLTRK